MSPRFELKDIGKHCRIHSVLPLSINLDYGRKRPDQVDSAVNQVQPSEKRKTSKQAPDKKYRELVWQRKLFDALVASGLNPEWEKKDAVPGRRFRIDIAFTPERVACEVDGFRHHKTLSAFKSDRKRQNLFVLAGWRVLRFFPGEISKDLVGCVEIVRKTLEAGAGT